MGHCGNQKVPSATPIPPRAAHGPPGHFPGKQLLWEQWGRLCSLCQEEEQEALFQPVPPLLHLPPAAIPACLGIPQAAREKAGISPLASALHLPQAPLSCHVDERLSGHICESRDSCCPQFLQEMDVPSLPPPLLTFKTLKSDQFFFPYSCGFFLPFSPCPSRKRKDSLKEMLVLNILRSGSLQ